MTEHPSSDIDLYADAVLLDPYPHYRALRDQAGAVWLERHEAFVLSRYADVRAALGNWEVFSSAGGVAMNDGMNAALKGGLLCSDPPQHDALRRIIERPLAPQMLAALREQITDQADALVDRLAARGTFDAVELARYLPVTIVSELVGLPEDGREHMLDWARANFDCLGPMNDRARRALPVLKDMLDYAFTQCVPGKLKPGSWAAMIWEAADRGEISLELCPYLMNDYMGPALDTTIFAATAAIWLFARNPEQWDAVRTTPGLLSGAINEVVRLESPIQGFSRVLTRDHEIDGVMLPAGARVVVLYASANRDERKWNNPDRFDVRRTNVHEHMAFGFGEHQCVGNNLARLEIRALLLALSKRVRRFELGDVRRGLNNILRGLEKCEVTIH